MDVRWRQRLWRVMQKPVWLVLVVAVAVFVSSAGRAEAAAPRILIISGKPLARQAVIADWGRIFSIVQAVTASRPIPSARLVDRPRLKVSMFWGPQWNDYLRSGNPATALLPAQANQSGSFYPAWRGRRAMIDLPWAGQWPRPVPAKALTILKRYGVLSWDISPRLRLNDSVRQGW